LAADSWFGLIELEKLDSGSGWEMVLDPALEAYEVTGAHLVLSGKKSSPVVLWGLNHVQATLALSGRRIDFSAIETIVSFRGARTVVKNKIGLVGQLSFCKGRSGDLVDKRLMAMG